MSKRKERKIRQLKIESAGSYASVQLKDMNLKTLKRNCIARGMDFEAVVKSSIPQLESWYLRHSFNDVDHERLDNYDRWIEAYLMNSRQISPEGKLAALFHPQLRMGYFGEDDEEGKPRLRRIKGITKKKKRRNKTEDGIYSGTKKALTFECAKEGLDKKSTIAKVLAAFPDAKEKSIGIWYNKALKS